MRQTAVAEATSDTACFLRRVAPFVAALPDPQRSQYESLAGFTSHMFSNAHVIPNNRAMAILLGEGNLAQRLDRLESTHSALNAVNTRLAESVIAWAETQYLTSPSIATYQLLDIARQWGRHAELGNHFLGPRFAEIVINGAAELGLNTSDVQDLAARSAENLEDSLLTKVKFSVRVTPQSTKACLKWLASMLLVANIRAERIEVEKINLHCEDRSLGVALFLSAEELKDPQSLLSTVKSAEVELLPVLGPYLLHIGRGIGFCQGYAGLKRFLALGLVLARHYTQSYNFAISLKSANQFEPFIMAAISRSD